MTKTVLTVLAAVALTFLGFVFGFLVSSSKIDLQLQLGTGLRVTPAQPVTPNIQPKFMSCSHQKF